MRAKASGNSLYFANALTPTLSREYKGEGTRRLPLALLALTLFGCAAKPDPIPHYALMDNRSSLAVVRDRLLAVHAVTGEATIILTDAKGQSVSLDGAYVFAPPGRARLRAWKFGQAVFDLTLREDGAWAFFPREQARPAAGDLRKSLGQWLDLLNGRDTLFDQEGLADGDTLGVMRAYGKGTGLYCDIDRRTLTPRRYFVAGSYPFDHPAFELTLSDYRVVGADQVWPMTMKAKSQSGTVEVHSRDVEINGDLPDTAFKPPARAEALP